MDIIYRWATQISTAWFDTNEVTPLPLRNSYSVYPECSCSFSEHLGSRKAIRDLISMALGDHDHARELRVFFQERLLPAQLSCGGLNRAIDVRRARNQCVFAWGGALPVEGE
jgi:hypothetical protein